MGGIKLVSGLGHDRDDTQALIYDLIEPRRPLADAKVLNFVLKTPFTGADFVIGEDGVCRVGAQLARRIVAMTAEVHPINAGLPLRL